jgi:16S rRNA (guanine527-N7)-methyltransferase
MKRLDELAERFDLPPGARKKLGILLRELAQKKAPTSVHDPVAGADVHVADSLVALELPEVRAAGLIADLGAGAGLPSLVLATALPDAHVVALDSTGKKTIFIAETAEAMGLANVEAVASRAEEWTSGLGRADVVTARALGALPIVCEYAAPLLREGGALVAWKGSVEPGELRDAEAAADALGLSRPEVHRVVPFKRSERRTLYVFRKVAPTPANFPRRSGMAAKKPLRAKPEARLEPPSRGT